MRLLRTLEILLKASRTHARYSTRVWAALFLPVLFGTVFQVSSRAKLEGLFVSFLIVVIYTAACLFEKNYLRGRRGRPR